jgi:pyruvate,water dikinase
VEIIQRNYPSRNQTTVPSETGPGIRIIDAGNAGIPPISDDAVEEITETVLDIERLFGYPVDVEWTRTGTELVLLQVRPITHSVADSSDKRPWYRSLTRSFENLKHLRSVIENEIIPGMEKTAKELSYIDFSSYNNEQIASEIRRRIAVHTSWKERYWQDCIPFAHGMRLFGHVYNDIIQPEDPYEFMELLRNQELISIRRNRLLWDMVKQRRRIQEGDQSSGARFEELMHEFLEQFEAEIREIATNVEESDLTSVVDGLLDEMAKSLFTADFSASQPRSDLEKQFLDQFSEDPHFAREILDLGRASYRWRDDDNHYLSRIHHEVQRAAVEGFKRLAIPNKMAKDLSPEQVAELLMGNDLHRTSENEESKTQVQVGIIPRQLTGQPASPGMAKGTAHVITSGSDLFSIRSGEILICDAIKPEMTFAVPLASAIVERRGGMLIHGAIIAREYGIPCITGVADVTKYIQTGDEIFVDAYVGIVTIISHR